MSICSITYLVIQVYPGIPCRLWSRLHLWPRRSQFHLWPLQVPLHLGHPYFHLVRWFLVNNLNIEALHIWYCNRSNTKCWYCRKFVILFPGAFDVHSCMLFVSLCVCLLVVSFSFCRFMYSPFVFCLFVCLPGRPGSPASPWSPLLPVFPFNPGNPLKRHTCILR